MTLTLINVKANGYHGGGGGELARSAPPVDVIYIASEHDWQYSGSLHDDREKRESW